MSKSSKQYWDSCLFLDLINATPGRHETLEAIAEELVKSDARLTAITSTLTIAEVATTEKERKGKRLSQDALDKINAFWSPGSPWQLVELYPLVTIQARDLIRKFTGRGRSLKPHDAIHLATAIRVGASVFLTYDEKLLSLGKQIGIEIRTPRSDQLPFPRSEDSLGVPTAEQKRAAKVRGTSRGAAPPG
jgi:predicted nucleic acid-binding protein